jgi:hypothetical protein
MGHREARLRRIREKFDMPGQKRHELVSSSPNEHCDHHIRVSQKHHKHIGTFLKTNAGDPLSWLKQQ